MKERGKIDGQWKKEIIPTFLNYLNYCAQAAIFHFKKKLLIKYILFVCLFSLSLCVSVCVYVRDENGEGENCSSPPSFPTPSIIDYSNLMATHSTDCNILEEWIRMDVCGCALFSFPFFPTTTTTITTTIYSFILWALLLLLLLIKYLYVDLRVLLKILRASARPRYLYLFHFRLYLFGLISPTPKYLVCFFSFLFFVSFCFCHIIEIHLQSMSRFVLVVCFFIIRKKKWKAESCRFQFSLVWWTRFFRVRLLWLLTGFRVFRKSQFCSASALPLRFFFLIVGLIFFFSFFFYYHFLCCALCTWWLDGVMGGVLSTVFPFGFSFFLSPFHIFRLFLSLFNFSIFE